MGGMTLCGPIMCQPHPPSCLPSSCLPNVPHPEGSLERPMKPEQSSFLLARLQFQEAESSLEATMAAFCSEISGHLRLKTWERVGGKQDKNCKMGVIPNFCAPHCGSFR
uniref:Uncharacterized protein n=1 Tax=Eutreptiella gymnastica TaxID=73025 RepID=A0A6U8NK74_9EUGL